MPRMRARLLLYSDVDVEPTAETLEERYDRPSMLPFARALVMAVAACALLPVNAPPSRLTVGIIEPTVIPKNLSLSLQSLPSLKEKG